MSVRCGNCKGEHDSSSAVRNCYGLGSATVAPAAPVAPTGNAVRDGFYTVQFGDGSYRTLRLRTQGDDARFAPGEQVAAFLSGPDNESSYTGFAFVKSDGRFFPWKRFREDTVIIEALKVLLGDPEAAGLAFARESGNCYICNRTLTTPESLERGIGPVCDGRS